ncbi:MAG: hypothetical protein WCW61_03420 [Patescibacteria group bacterium]
MVLPLVQKTIQSVFPKLNDVVSYQGDFEKTLKEIPKNGELVVITSDMFYDQDNVKFSGKEKNGSKLAEEIKKINHAAKVYVFSMYKPKPEFIDGFYPKSQGSDNTLQEIVAIFIDLGLDKEIAPPKKADKVIKLDSIGKENLETICQLLGLAFGRFENLGECIQVYFKENGKEILDRCLAINETGEIFICVDLPGDNIIVNTVPVVLYLHSQNLLV